MIGSELKIKFIADKAFLTNNKSWTLEEIVLPTSSKLFNPPAYWIIRVLNYIPTEKKIFVEVLSYKVGECDFNCSQINLSDTLREIKTVSYKTIDSDGLFGTLRGTKNLSYTPQMHRYLERKEYNFLQTKSIPILPEPVKSTIKQTFSFPLKKVQFKHGGVSFEKKIKFRKTIDANSKYFSFCHLR